MSHNVPETLNPDENLTKALAWILHSRHANRLMECFREIQKV